jgi:PKD domain
MNMRINHRLPAALLLALGITGAANSANACSIDLKPSLSANGVLDAVNRAVPINSTQLKAFAAAGPFVFSAPFAPRKTIIFAENRRDIAQSLLPDAMITPWRWHFGDGTIAYGWTVKHAYARKGDLRIQVDAYLPKTKQWYEFDRVTIHVR